MKANDDVRVHKVKQVTISVERLAELILDNSLANGDIVDATGLAWPWEMVSLDRIDPKQGYVEGNLRWLLIGLNMFRSDNPDDLGLKEWHEG